MTIPPGRDAGPEETHDADQIVCVIEGEMRVGEQRSIVGAGRPVTVSAGTVHHVRSVGKALGS